jgi:uncharacterized protein (TIGR03000 family)
MSKQVAEVLSQANTSLEEQWLRRFRELGGKVEELHFASNEQALIVYLASSEQPNLAVPALTTNPQLSVHETFVEDRVRPTLAGKTFTSQEFEKWGKQVSRYSGNPPADLKDKNWSMTFAEEPVRIAFNKGSIALTLCGGSYATEEREYPAMNVTARYRVKHSRTGFRLIRIDKLEVYPPGFRPGSGERLGVRQQILRSLLQRRFDRLLPQELNLDQSTLPAELAQLDLGRRARVLLQDGWLRLEYAPAFRPILIADDSESHLIERKKDENRKEHEAAAHASLEVVLPRNGKLSIDGQAVSVTNSRRTFSTPDLANNQTYFYELRVEMQQGSKQASETRRVVLRRGDEVREDFRNLEDRAPVP